MAAKSKRWRATVNFGGGDEPAHEAGKLLPPNFKPTKVQIDRGDAVEHETKGTN